VQASGDYFAHSADDAFELAVGVLIDTQLCERAGIRGHHPPQPRRDATGRSEIGFG
jgi:hypothetical protein